MKKHVRIFALLLTVIMLCTSGVFALISTAESAAPLAKVEADVSDLSFTAGELVVLDQDFENTAANTIFTKSSQSGYPVIENGNNGYEFGKVAVLDYSTRNWTNASGSDYVTDTDYIVGHIYTGTSSRDDKLPYVPNEADGYVFTFDFCNYGETTTEDIWVNIYDDEATTSKNGYRIYTEQFKDKNWYRVTITRNTEQRTVTMTQLTGSGKGTTSNVSYSTINLSGSRNNQVSITMYPSAEVKNGGDAALRSAERQKSCFMLDNIKLVTEGVQTETRTETIVGQDYESVANNQAFAQSYVAGSNDEKINGLPVITEGANGWTGGNVADFDFSKLDWSKLDPYYPVGMLAIKGVKNIAGNSIEYIPSKADGYVFSFDFHCIKGYSGDCFWVNIYDGAGSYNNYNGFKIDISQFEDNTWYHIEINNLGAGTVATKTVLNGGKKGTSSSLSYSNSAISSRKNAINMVFYGSPNTSAERQQSHYQLDNFALTIEKKPAITTKLTTGSVSSTAQPLLVAYNSNGTVKSVINGKLTDASTGTATFEMGAEYDAFLMADEVKVLYWDGLTNAKPLTAVVEIGDTIYDGVDEEAPEKDEIAITADMLPESGEEYSLLVYAVPNTTEADNIPTYNSATHKLLTINQFATVPGSIVYEKELYDYTANHIVVKISNGTTTKTTLIEGLSPPQHTNIVIQLGRDDSELNFTWYSLNSAIGEIRWAKASDCDNGELPATYFYAAAQRTNSKKTNYYANKATISGLQSNTDYYYVLVNGDKMTEPKLISVGEVDSSFSFAFAGDAQIGRGYKNDETFGPQVDAIKKDHQSWGLTLKQMTTSKEFEGVEFLMHAGDQVNAFFHSYAEPFKYHEMQWDGYSNHDELLTIPQVTVGGNHDNYNYSVYSFHVNEPNMLLKEDGKPYGATYDGAYGHLVDADYYFVYNEVLFMVLNVNNFKATSASASNTAKDKAVAEEHAAFVERVMEETEGLKINWTIVLYHESPYGSSYHGNYTTNSSGTYNRSEQYAFINMRQFLLPVLYENGVDLILSGHDHCYTRTHVLKPATDSEGNYIDASIVTPYSEGTYVYEDGSTTPTFVKWTDAMGKVYTDAKVSSKPVKVYNPDGIVHITGATSSGSQVNPAEYEHLYTAVNGTAATRQLSRIDITENTLKIVTYNLGTETTEEITLFDTFEIIHTTEEEEETEITSANLELAEDIAVRYYVTVNNSINTADLSMRFTMNGKSVVVDEFITDGARLVFSFKGISPQCMGDNIKAELLLGDEVIATKDEYSILTYAQSMLKNEPSAELTALLVDLLNYGAAAQIYTGYKTDALVNKGITAGSTSVTPNESDDIRYASASQNANIEALSMGVRFDYINSVFMTFKAPSTDGITVKINSVEAEIQTVTNGKYKVYSNGLSPLEYAKELVFEIYYNGNLVQTVNYSLNSYAYALGDTNNAMAELAIALYRYGKSAVEYAKQ